MLVKKNVGIWIPYHDSGYSAQFEVETFGNSVLVKASKNSNVRNDIVFEGELANWYFEDCSIR